MKLSKVQQEVVDKMRCGWEMVINYNWGEYYITYWETREREDISFKMHLQLLKYGVIKYKNAEGRLSIYQLTEKYRSNEG